MTFEDGFETGVRFVIQRIERYTKGTGDPITQFGDYQMTMYERNSDERLMKGSTDHQEKRIQAIIALARKEGLIS